MREIDFYKIPLSFSIRKTIKRMDDGGIGFVVCVDDNDIVIGVISDGDFRRAVLSGISLEKRALEIINRDFIHVPVDYEAKDIANIFQKGIAQQIPVVDGGKLVDIITEESLYLHQKTIKYKRKKLNLPVVIMAGGKGTRLEPFTHILPKPLIPIGDKPIIEIIMDNYAKFGMTRFYVSVNHKAKMIKAYFEDFSEKYHILFIDEDKPLGTAGALKFLENKIKSPFFVTNCDILIETNYLEIYKYHKQGNYSMTFVGSMQHHIIPYGVCKIDNDGELKEMKEKPEYDFLVNTGMYILNPDTFKFIPYNESFDITDLIRKLKQNNKKIGVYPVSEKSWIDIGQWEEYKKSLSMLLGT